MGSMQGLERAQALVGYFHYRNEMVEIFESSPLAAIIAQGVDTSKDPYGVSERYVFSS